MADPASVVGVISDFRTEHGISHRVSCRALGVSESWFYKHRTHRPTRRELRRQHLIEAVKEEFDDSGGTYGSPKIWIRLVRQGWQVSVNTIAKIMAGLGLVARKVRRRRGLTRPGKRPAAPDFVRRDFTAEAPDLVWCGDKPVPCIRQSRFDDQRPTSRTVMVAPPLLRRRPMTGVSFASAAGAIYRTGDFLFRPFGTPPRPCAAL